MTNIMKFETLIDDLITDDDQRNMLLDDIQTEADVNRFHHGFTKNEMKVGISEFVALGMQIGHDEKATAEKFEAATTLMMRQRLIREMAYSEIVEKRTPNLVPTESKKTKPVLADISEFKY